MKVFKYCVGLHRPGIGDWRDGIVVANTKDEATGLLLEKYPNSTTQHMEIIEIDTSGLLVEEISKDYWEE